MKGYKSREMDPGYSCEVDTMEPEAWHGIIALFDDISFYQTWAYGEVRWGKEKLSHLVLKYNDTPVAAAQLRIETFPLNTGGVAYLTWGPLWRPADLPADDCRLKNMLRALYTEYVVRRRCLLRLQPKVIAKGSDAEQLRRIYLEEGFKWSPDPQKTVLVDLGPPLEEIRARLGKGWKRNLKKGEKAGLEISEGSNGGLSKVAAEIVKEMKRRKKFVEFSDVEEILAVNEALPSKLKLHLAVGFAGGEPVAALGWFPLGRFGLPLVGGTGTEGLRLSASFPLWWKMVADYKSRGFMHINLAGTNREKNPGGHYFKSGLAGRDSREQGYIGFFEACDNPLSALAFQFGNSLRSLYRSLLQLAGRLRKKAA